MNQPAAADSSEAPSSPWPLLPPGPQPTLLNALEQEIPVHRIARRISEMIEAGRHPGSDTAGNQWATVEAGLKLYLEFARAASPTNPSAPPPGSSASPAPVSGSSTPPAPALVPALPAGNPIVPSRENLTRPGTAPQKYRLGRHLESEDRLRNFMVYQRPISGRTESQRTQRRPSPSSVSSGKAESGAGMTGVPAADPIKGAQERTLFLLAKFGAAAVLTLAAATGFLLRQSPAPGQMGPAAAFRGTGTSPTFTLTSPVATAVASDLSDKTAVPAAPPPAGWASHAAYQAWSPKFDVSMEEAGNGNAPGDDFSVGDAGF